MRGATAIEYAFLVALFTVPLVEVVEIVQDQQGEQITESGNRAGTPAEYSSGVPPVPPPTTLDDGSNGSGDTNIETFAALTTRGMREGAKWTAVAEIAATDANGSVSGGVFEGTWEIYDLAGTLDRTVAASCTIDTKGDCTVSLASLNFSTADKDHSATFTITKLDSEDLVPAAGVIGSSVTIAKTDI